MTQRPALSAAWALLPACLLACGGGSIGGEDGGAGSKTPPPAGDSQLAQAILSAHNAARAAASPTPIPTLSPLGWSAAAASAAQAWADGCTWEHDPKLGTLGMGQNIYALGSTAATFDTDPAEVVASWVSEAADYTYATNTCATGKVCGHYTAVVWRSTTAVGCGHRVCSTGSPWGSAYPSWDLWVCNYLPPGNWEGRKPY